MSKLIKPQRASDWRPEKLRKADFPLIMQPKIDGVRGGRYFGTPTFTGRTLKAFKNRALTKFWSNNDFIGIDGELVLPDVPWTYPGMCRLTTGLTGRINDKAIPELIAFDYVTDKTIDLPYYERYKRLARQTRSLAVPKLHIMPWVEVRNVDEIEEQDSEWLEQGFEGSILRRPGAMFKEGYSGLGLELWRIKRFIDFEFIIDELIEAMENRNEAKVNALGRTERSSHKANKVGKGMVGMLRGRILKDVKHDGTLLFKKGMVVDVGPGEMPHIDRIHYWHHQDEIVGQIGKAKTFPKGVLTKPRMPTFVTIRSKEDL